jgi:hypothetical protein
VDAREILAATAHGAAFWTALFAFRAFDPGRGAGGVRLACGLGLGALLAHAGFALLHLDRIGADARWWLAPWAGHTELALPLGVFALAPRRARGRQTFLAAALRALAPALAVARLGCLAAGCCGGVAGHPTPVYAMAGLAALALALARAPAALVPAAFAAGFGALRLALEPLRVPDPWGAPLVPPALLALAWVAFGGAQAEAARRAARPTPASVGRPISRRASPAPRGGSSRRSRQSRCPR